MADDLETWQRILARDADAFDSFYREHAPRLTAFLRQVTGSRQAAEDVAQETFSQMWSRPNGYQPGRGALKAYLFGAARKRASEWWRSQRPTERLEEGLHEGGTGRSSSAESQAQIKDALERLLPEQRALLWLREVEGQSYAELAEILGVPIGTVRSRLFAAREALRETWHAQRPGTTSEKGRRV
ncbi:RNA polymerase sigma factor [Silvibacterium dinghuense]|uniref:RNA polymerase sigma factor n=1 Tax=Silvibacterium dinghuense TaxID=1560006 RepID=UPI0013E956D6|nr:RNA polymerase sigma factor [Silvibacterium dinghuense]GGH01162.1 DNA-directed RNA polymerase sigma-70 factor [Silvibacterium dinghuense]